jgi:hypothetical protein
MPDPIKKSKETPAAATLKAETKQVKQDEPLIYLGPSLPGGSLLQNTVLTRGIPDYVDLKKYSSIKPLFVPIGQLKDFEKRLSQPGSAEQTFFNSAKKELRG